MDPVQQWLEPFRSYLSLEAFLEAMTPADGSAEAEDADAFFKGLLSPLDDMDLATGAWTSFFMSERALEGLTATPEGARDFVLERLRTGSELTPGHAVPLAEANFKLRDYGRSEIATAVAYLLGARDETVLALLAGMGVRDGRLEAVAQVLAEAERLHPGSAELGFCRGIAQVAGDQLDQAASTLEAVVENAPGHRPAWALLIDVLLRSGAYAQAAKAGARATSLHREDPLLWGRLARARRGTGDLPAAVGAMARAREALARTVARREDVTLHLELEDAQIHEALGRTEEALGIYRGLRDRGLGVPAVYANAASCLLRSGRTEEAVRWLDEGLEAEPDDPDLLTNLGEVLFEAGDDERAFELLQRGAEQDASRSGNLVLMAAICLRNRRFREAAEIAAAVVERDPGRTVEALVVLGDALRFQGHDADALAAYERAGELAPQNEAVAARLRQAEKKCAGAVKGPGVPTDKEGDRPDAGKERR